MPHNATHEPSARWRGDRTARTPYEFLQSENYGQGYCVLTASSLPVPGPARFFTLSKDEQNMSTFIGSTVYPTFPYTTNKAFIYTQTTLNCFSWSIANTWYVMIVEDGGAGVEWPPVQSGSWTYYYPVQFAYACGSRVFYYGQRESGDWFIQELLADGNMGSTTASGKWQKYYPIQFPYEAGGNTWYYGQRETGDWFIQGLNADGTMGPQTQSGQWGKYYRVQFPYQAGGRTWYYGQNDDNRGWFIQELLPDGTMGAQTASGTWQKFYPVQFPYTIDGHVYYYGQRGSGDWFIQELLPDGTMGGQTASGAWQKYYDVQFPLYLGDRVFYFGARPDGDNLAWFIQELLPGGQMGNQISSGAINPGTASYRSNAPASDDFLS